MSYGIKLLVWGEYAAFNRPEMKVERVSYDVITPSAARGILEAIYWKPQIRWVVDRIHVLKPIRFTHVRRNEISNKIPIGGKAGVAAAMKTGTGRLGVAVEEQRQQRAAMILRDVRYGIAAHLEVQDPTEVGGKPLGKPEGKHLDIFKRRARKGQYFHHPYFGCREFPVDFELTDSFPPCPKEFPPEKDLGYMLHDMIFIPDKKGRVIESNAGNKLRAEARFFRAYMRNGIVDVPSIEDTKA